MRRVIWQYWETRGRKPAFIDGLHELARANSGCEVVLVTPKTLGQFLPDMPAAIGRIREPAHKADMIRALLVQRHGGMWLDSDAIVLRELGALFDHLADVEFVGFNDGGRLTADRPWVRVNCFLSRPGGAVIEAWVAAQHALLPRRNFGWNEIGSRLLNPICMAHPGTVRILPFEWICPVAWDQVRDFLGPDDDAAAIIERCLMVMLSNHSLGRQARSLLRQSCEEIASAQTLVAAIMRAALKAPLAAGSALDVGRS
jgi:hypothetical protein